MSLPASGLRHAGHDRRERLGLGRRGRHAGRYGTGHRNAGG